MKIIVLHPSPVLSAHYHTSKDLISGIVRYMEILSTVHRLLDGKPGKIENSQFGRRAGLMEYPWVLSDEEGRSPRIFLATHFTSACVEKTKECAGNYEWLASLLRACLNEHASRFRRNHYLRVLEDDLKEHPQNIPPGDCTVDLEAKVRECRDEYRSQEGKASWYPRPAPEWFHVKSSPAVHQE